MLRPRQVQLRLIIQFDLAIKLVQLVIVRIFVSIGDASLARCVRAGSGCIDPDNLRDYPLLVFLLDGKLELRNAACPIFGLHVAAVG